MRPGQTAPEFKAVMKQLRFVLQASMRPGQTAPEFSRRLEIRLGGRPSFNEAGADCPGIRESPDACAERGCPLQ